MTPLEWGIVVAIVALLGALVYTVWPLRIIVAFPPSFTLQQNQSAGMAVALLYKPWFHRTPKRTQGTVTIVSPPSIVQVIPSTASTSHTAAATFTVTGVTVGTGIFKVNGTSRHGSHDTIDIPVTVTAIPE
jgi:hypothetical protein